MRQLIEGTDCNFKIDSRYDILIRNKIVTIISTMGSGSHSFYLSHANCLEAFKAVDRFYTNDPVVSSRMAERLKLIYSINL